MKFKFDYTDDGNFQIIDVSTNPQTRITNPERLNNVFWYKVPAWFRYQNRSFVAFTPYFGNECIQEITQTVFGTGEDPIFDMN